MDKGKKALLAVLVDFVMLVLVVFSVYRLLFKPDTQIVKNVLTAVIVIAIPVMFYVTYMAAAGDKFEYNEDEFGDEPEVGDALEIEDISESADDMETGDNPENGNNDSHSKNL